MPDAKVVTLIILIILLVIAAIVGLTFTALLSDRMGRIKRLENERAFLKKLVESKTCECK